MTTDLLQPQPSAKFASPYFLFDDSLNLVGEMSGDSWPVAVLAGLQVCVRNAVTAGQSSFVPFDVGPRWCILPVRCEGTARFAVCIEGSN